MKIATAFSGGFGSIEFAMKCENIKHEVVFACEWLDPQRKSYLHNHGEPTSNFYKDIRDMDGTKYKGEIDLYHLSPPCQSYSLAGRRGGAADERGGLMFSAIKSINEVQPKMFTIENVKGLLSSNGGEDWKNILSDVRSLKGYTVQYGVMNAKDQGTPQNRERLFIVGFRGECMPMPFPSVTKLDKCLANVLEDEVDEKYYLSKKAIANFIKKDSDPNNNMSIQAFHSREDDYSATITARYNKRGITDPYILESINKIGFINQDTQASQVFSSDGVCPSLCAGTHGYAQGYIAELKQIGNIDQKGHNSLWGRVYDPDGIAPTQNAKGGGGGGAKTGLVLVDQPHKDFPYGIIEIDGEYYAVRRLTPRECSRVQGDFNDMFKQGDASDTKLYEFVGNAMDISTTRNLLKTMFAHKVEFGEPQEPSFVRSETAQKSLF